MLDMMMLNVAGVVPSVERTTDWAVTSVMFFEEGVVWATYPH